MTLNCIWWWGSISAILGSATFSLVHFYSANKPNIKEWLTEISQLNRKIVDSCYRVLDSEESGLNQDEIEEGIYSVTIISKMHDMLPALEKVNIYSNPSDDTREKNSTTVESLERYIQCTKFNGKNMNKKISESPHSLKIFRLLEKRSKSIADETALFLL